MLPDSSKPVSDKTRTVHLLPVLTYYATTDWRCLPLLATTKYGFLKLGYLTILLLMALAHPMHLF